MLPHMKADFVYVAIGLADSAEQLLKELNVQIARSWLNEEDGEAGFEVKQLTSEQVKTLQDRIPRVTVEPDMTYVSFEL